VVTDVGDLGILARIYRVGKVVPPSRPDRLAEAMLEIIQEKRNHTKEMAILIKLLSIDRAAERFLKKLPWLQEISRAKAKKRTRIAV
jgi:hypothetical protein